MGVLTKVLKGCLGSDIMRKQRQFLLFGIPTWLLATIQVGLAFITLIFAGRMGDAMLAGVGLGNTMYNVLLWSVLWGFTSALDTFGPQVYACSDKKYHLGTVTLKIALQGLVVYIFILGPYLNSTHLVMLLPAEGAGLHDELHVQTLDAPHNLTRSIIYIHNIYNNRSSSSSSYNNESSSADPQYPLQNNLEITVRYMRLVCLVPLLDFFVSIISKYLTIQKYITEVYVISLTMIVLHILWNFTLVKWCHLGLTGLAMSAVLTRLVTLFLLLVYCWAKRKELAWCGYSPAVCRNWGESLKLGLSGAANLFVELGMFEIATFLSQFNGTAVLATVVIIFQISVCCYTVPVGISTATTIIIGNALGERNKSEVRSYMKLAVINTLTLAILISILFFFFRYPLVRLFTSSDAVVEKFTGCVWLFLLQMPFDHLQTVLCRGILIAFGRQRFIAISLALICYTISTPLIVVFVFYTNLGPLGIVTAFLVFAVLNSITGACKIASLSIDKEIERADWRGAESSGTGSTDDLISCSDYTMNETTPLTGDRRRMRMNERNVLILVGVGVSFLGILVYLSTL